MNYSDLMEAFHAKVGEYAVNKTAEVMEATDVDRLAEGLIWFDNNIKNSIQIHDFIGELNDLIIKGKLTFEFWNTRHIEMLTNSPLRNYPEFEIFISGLINIDKFPIAERKEYYLAQVVPNMEQSTEALLSIQEGKQMLEQFKQQISDKIKSVSH